MKKINVKEFTNEELVNAISKWLIEKHHSYFAASELRSGDWLEFYEEKINEEN